MTKIKTVGGSSLRTAIEIISLLLLFTGAAGAATQIVNAIDPVGDVNHSYIDIVQVIINKDSDIYTAQIIVNGNIDTTNAQYTITTNDGFKDNYMIVINSNNSGLFENTSTLFENTSTWLYNEVRKVQASANGNTLNIVADFSGIDLTGSTFRKAGAFLYAADKKTLIEKDTVKFTTTPTPTPTPAASETTVSISNTTTTPNSNITRSIMVENVNNLAAATIWLTYDPNVVNVLSVSAGDFGGVTPNIDNTIGKVTMSAFSATAKSGSVTFATVLLRAVGSINTTSPLTLSVPALSDQNGVPINYTTRNGIFTISSVVKGDVNGDNQITIVDALFVAQYTVGMKSLSASQLAAADVNGDTQVTIVDALFIAQYTVGLRQL